jgi:hypothetical protein
MSIKNLDGVKNLIQILFLSTTLLHPAISFLGEKRAGNRKVGIFLTEHSMTTPPTPRQSWPAGQAKEAEQKAAYIATWSLAVSAPHQTFCPKAFLWYWNFQKGHFILTDKGWAL